MKELLRTNDAVRLSWLQSVLADAGVTSIVLDQHTSVIEGSIGAIPRRLMVDDADHFRATAILRAAEQDLE
jgi:Putative prokaryotic signal transducing protein